MTQDRPTGTPVPGRRPGGDDRHDDLAVLIAAALRSREPDAADTAATAQRIAARLDAAPDGRSTAAPPLVRRAGLVAVTGVVTSTIVAAGATAAAAANPYSGFAVVVEDVVHAVGVEWSAMPDGFTREQYDAFWGAEYTSEDVDRLADLWNVDVTAAKARAGQLILDGRTVPVEPGSSGPEPVVSQVSAGDMAAFRKAGYSVQDAERLAELWQVDMYEAKVRVADMLRKGETPPPPSP